MLKKMFVFRVYILLCICAIHVPYLRAKRESKPCAFSDGFSGGG